MIRSIAHTILPSHTYHFFSCPCIDFLFRTKPITRSVFLDAVFMYNSSKPEPRGEHIAVMMVATLHALREGERKPSFEIDFV